jgi:hypothetical protein
MMISRIAILTAALAWSVPAFAWWDEGHMKIAALAYEQLTPAARGEANGLIRLNPDYPEWVARYDVLHAISFALCSTPIWEGDFQWML